MDNMAGIEIKLSEDTLDNLPSNKEGMIRFLAKHFDAVIDDYNIRLRERVSGSLGGPLSSYERAIIKDFLIDVTLGKLHQPPTEPIVSYIAA